MFLILGLFLSSCDNTLNVNAPYKDIPVVNAILNPSDTAQYIKLERVFQSVDQSALEVAQVIDSLYYPNAAIALINMNTNERFNLEKVDGNLEGYPRENGAFINDPNYLYKIRTAELNLLGGEQYMLEINRSENLDLVTSMINVVEEPIIIAPQNSGNLHFSSFNKFSIKVKDSDYGEIMDIVFDIHVTEVDHSNPSLPAVKKKLSWEVVSGWTKNDYKGDGEAFYSFLAGQLEEKEAISRTINSIDLRVIVGGKALREFIKLGSANLFSITSSEGIPNYSNLSDGIGIFSSRYQYLIEDYGLTVRTIDSLENGVITKKFNFQQ